jgi:alkylated DNA repair dioxygenase AlkB
MHLTLDHYKDLGYAYVSEFFTKEETQYYTQIMLDAKNNNALKAETDIRYYNNSQGGCPAEFRTALQNKTQQIKDLLGLTNVTAESVYARFYHNESTLNPHFDRKGLDHTLSVTLFTNLDEPWPLYCIDRKCNVVSFDIKPGDGAIIPGTRIVHWRRPLSCKPDQFAIQAFFHWKDPA